jgi:hypothetical protein
MDYLELLPEMYRDSLLLREYVSAVGAQFDSMQTSISNLYTLVNPNTVPITYIQRLADLLNLQIYGSNTRTDAQLRQQLIQAVDWYKIKGTYQSLINIAYLFNLRCSIKDLYTSDYVTFVPEDWYIGQLGTNPGGLGNTYYKSPHFGCYFNLDVAKLKENPPSSNDMYYLWQGTDITDFTSFVEVIRPVNTVPHYTIQLSPVTKQDGVLNTLTNGKIHTQTFEDWLPSTNYYDSGLLFDSSNVFDQSVSAFISSIVNWKLGDGNKGGLPNSSGVSSPVLVGSGSDIVLNAQPTYNEFQITIPKATVASGISELALYTNTNVCVLSCTFPDVDKTADTDWYINIVVNK